MQGMIKVNFRDLETLEFPEGTTYEEISHSFQKYFGYPILVAKVDNHLKSLKSQLDKASDEDVKREINSKIEEKEMSLSDIAELQNISYESAQQKIHKIRSRVRRQVIGFMDGKMGGIA